METSNPALRSKTFREARATNDEVMTIGGTVNKSFFLITLTILAACWTWTNPQGFTPFFMPAILGGFIVSLVIIFKPTTAPYLAPIYAIGEGILLGTVSALLEVRYPGIAFQAMLCTTGTFIGLLIAYRAKLIQATQGFRAGLMMAMFGIFFAYIMDMILGFFGIHVPFIHSTGPFGILVSVVITTVAALNLILDFDMIERGAQMRAPKYMEWYSAFALLVTLVWLYMEMLRLLSKIRDR